MNVADQHQSPSLPVPLEQLCDPANWSFLSEQLEPMAFPVATGDALGWMTALGVVASTFRYKHRLSLQAPLTVLASPSVCETMEPFRSSLAHLDVVLHSFGIERHQVAVIDPERFRSFHRGDGWGARFTLPAPGVLVDVRPLDDPPPLQHE